MKKILAVLAVLALGSLVYAQSDLLTNTNYPYSKVNGTYQGPITNVAKQSVSMAILVAGGTTSTVTVVTNIVVQRDNGSYVNTNKYLP